jgi:hypothetical protein
MAYSGADIFMKMNSNCATTQRLDSAQQASHRLEVVHHEMADALGTCQEGLNTFWKGKGAESASGSLTPLITASNDTAVELRRVRESMYEQNSAFHETRGNLLPVDADRPDDSGLFDYTSIGASDAEKAAAKWDADNRHNIAQYNSYDQVTQANQGGVQVAYIPVGANPESGGITTPQSAGSVGQTGGSGPYAGSGGGYNGPTSASGYSGGTGTPMTSAPQVSSPAAAAPPSPQPQIPPAARWTPPNTLRPHRHHGRATRGFCRRGATGRRIRAFRILVPVASARRVARDSVRPVSAAQEGSGRAVVRVAVAVLAMEAIAASARRVAAPQVRRARQVVSPVWDALPVRRCPARVPPYAVVQLDRPAQQVAAAEA